MGNHAAYPAPGFARLEAPRCWEWFPEQSSACRGALHDDHVAQLPRLRSHLEPRARGENCRGHWPGVPRQGRQRDPGSQRAGAQGGQEREELRVHVRGGPILGRAAHRCIRPGGAARGRDCVHEALRLQRAGDDQGRRQLHRGRAHRLGALLPALRGWSRCWRWVRHVQLQQDQRHVRLCQRELAGARPQEEDGLPRLRDERLVGAARPA
mmetsp:Transcript_7550/g.22979  ORF Transcript_7550/g.22979 Transcript_7550/m.22979 type:complete len:210 (+) Transcript_7550:3-632(+)